MTAFLNSKLLQPYTNLEKVGEGGMGEVYRAYDTINERVVAIKRFNSSRSHNQSEAKERLLREAKVANQLDHPNIASIYEIQEFENEVLIIRPFYEGITLQEKLSSTKLSVSHALTITLQICSALEHAHTKNIIHRDVKPENIFMLENGDALLMDFGLAKASDLFNEALTQTGSIVGTIDYISPEGIKGLPINQQSDIWSLGVVLFEMVCGKKPFGSGHDISATMLNIVTQLTPPIERDGSLENIIHKTLAKDLGERYQSISELSNDLVGFIAGDSIRINPIKIPDNLLIQNPTSKSNNQLIKNNLDDIDKGFIGRENETKLINYYLASAESRLVTILGSGGYGKTALAKQIAYKQCSLSYFDDGIYFVNLESITSKFGIPAALASVLNLNFNGNSDLNEQILNSLGNKNILLVLDNSEHLKNDLDIIIDILNKCLNVKILCTSRLRLAFENEWIIRLNGLNIPPEVTNKSLVDALDYSAVELFEKKAKRTTPSFTITKNNISTVVDICTVLQGSPLAIELAASWVRIFEPNRILEEINSNLDFLSSNDDSGSHRSMRAVFDHSWELLEPYQRLFLAKLAIFKGEFNVSAVEAICDVDKPEILYELIDAFLVQETEENYFDLQPLIKQYVSEKLKTASSLHQITSQRHSEYYITSVLKVSHSIRTKHQDKYLSQLAKDFENIKSSWFWLLESNHTLDTYTVTNSAEVLKRFFLSNCRFSEGTNFFDTSILILKSDVEHTKLISHFKAHLAGLKLTTNELDSVYKLAKESFVSLIKLKDFSGAMLPLSILGIYQASSGNYSSAQKYFQKSVALAEEFSAIDQATHMSNLAIAEQCLGNYDMSERYNEKALKLARKFQLSSQELTLCNNLASLMLAKKDTVKAILYLEDSLSLAEELASNDMIPYIHSNLGSVYFQLEEYTIAIEHYTKALEQANHNEQSDIGILIYSELGRVHLANKDSKSAKNYLLESLTLSLCHQHAQYNFKALTYWAQYLVVIGDLITSASILFFITNNDTVDQESIELAEKMLKNISKHVTLTDLDEARQKAKSYDLTSLLEDILRINKFIAPPIEMIESKTNMNHLY